MREVYFESLKLQGFIQELRAQRALAALESLQVPMAQVIRDHKQAAINAKELVPGDIVLLEEGCQIPADLRLFEALNLQVSLLLIFNHA